MANYDLEKEKCEIPFLYCGKVLEATYGNTKFLLKSATEYVTKERDTFIRSFEFPAYVDLGYYFVSNFELLDDSDNTIDFTWLNKDNYIALKRSNQYEQIKNIKVNIDNLSSSIFPRKLSAEKDVKLIVYGDKSDLNPAKQIKLYRDFLSCNNGCFNEVDLIGFRPVVREMMSAYSEKNGVSIAGKEKVKTYIR